MESNGIIHCIGDSHASFFSGYDEIQPQFPDQSRNLYPFFRSYRLGAVLAYNLVNLNTREQGREKLLDLISSLDTGAAVLLCFGEIDCRCHLLKQADIQNQPLEAVVGNCVKNYFSAVDELIERKFKVLVWGVIPSARSSNEDYPTYGSMEQRNECTAQFNRQLKEECLKRGIAFISIFDNLINGQKETKLEYYFDTIHLGQVARYMVLKEFKKNKVSPIFKKYSWIYITLLAGYSRALIFTKKIYKFIFR